MYEDYLLARMDSNHQPFDYLLLQFSLPDKLFVVWTIPSSLALPSRMSSLQSLHLPFQAWLSVDISFDLVFTEFRQFSISNYSNKLLSIYSQMHRQLCYYPSSNKLYQESSQSQATFKKIVVAIIITIPKIISVSLRCSFIIYFTLGLLRLSSIRFICKSSSVICSSFFLQPILFWFWVDSNFSQCSCSLYIVLEYRLFVERCSVLLIFSDQYFQQVLVHIRYYH